jgi:putative transposase
VSTAGFYEWASRPASATEQRRNRLKLPVLKAFNDNKGRYGYRRVHAVLTRWGPGLHAGVGPRILMRELGLVPCQPRRSRKGTTRQAAKQAQIPDLVNRDFTARAPRGR